MSVFKGLNCEPVGPVEKPQGFFFLQDPLIVVYVTLIYESTPTAKTGAVFPLGAVSGKRW